MRWLLALLLSGCAVTQPTTSESSPSPGCGWIKDGTWCCIHEVPGGKMLMMQCIAKKQKKDET